MTTYRGMFFTHTSDGLASITPPQAYDRGYADAEARYKPLVEALANMVEHFATPPEERLPGSYGLSNKQVAAQARAALAAWKEAQS